MKKKRKKWNWDDTTVGFSERFCAIKVYLFCSVPNFFFSPPKLVLTENFHNFLPNKVKKEKNKKTERSKEEKKLKIDSDNTLILLKIMSTISYIVHCVYHCSAILNG